MITFGKVITLIILLCVFIYTISYGRWTWRNKNRLGAIMVFIVALAVIILPVYSFFFREG